MAAGSTSLSVIEERFFLCAICFNPLKEPKQLPCLHRYCRDCLNGHIIKGGESFRCPMCNLHCKTPTGGADGYKTDFYIKSVVEFIQLQNSFKQDNYKYCLGCGEIQAVIAYCFKCKSFLCDKWYRFHLDNYMVSDHQGHVLNLKTVEVSNFSLEKLASLTEDPRCHIHVKHAAQLCCGTCGNMPICVACTYGEHKGHELQEVKLLAKAEREKLEIQLSEINKYKTSLYELSNKVNIAREVFDTRVGDRMARLTLQHKKKYDHVNDEVKRSMAEMERTTMEINKRRENDINAAKAKCDEEMEQLQIRYDGVIAEKEQWYDGEVKQAKDRHGARNEELLNERRCLDSKLDDLQNRVDETKADVHEQFKDIMDHSKHTVSRYENFAALASTVLASNDEWTDARCLPDMYGATVPLLDDVKKEFPLLGLTGDPSIIDLPASFVDKVTLTNHPVAVLDVECRRESAWSVTGVTSTIGENIILSGCQSDSTTHITVVNLKGEVSTQRIIEMTEGESSYEAARFCESLTGPVERVATVCGSNQVGVFAVSSGDHAKSDIRDVDVKWPYWCTCVATDSAGKIYVGGIGNTVLVVNDKINLEGVLKLPGNVKDVKDMCVHDGGLVVCSMMGKNVTKYTMDGPSPSLISELPRPNYDGRDWGPVSVCADSNSFLYVLWWRSHHRLLTQYNQDGRSLLMAKLVDDDAQCIAAMMTKHDEKLLLVTRSSSKIYIFDLVS